MAVANDPWKGYWQGSATGTPQQASLDNLDPAVKAVMEGVWQEFAASLPRRARVLDLGTGGGIVLRVLQAHRPDLRLTGVDAAEALPAGPPGIRLRPGIRLESLPFTDGEWDALTSRFGIEYAELAPAAKEAARILKRGGRLRFLIHHRDGAIVRHNAARLEALLWVWRDSGLLAKARALVRGRRFTPLPTPDHFRAAQSEARARFPQQPVAWEFATAVVQTLDMGRGRPEAEVLDVLATLEVRAREEAGRVEALMAAACGAERIGELQDRLAAASVRTATPALVAARAGADILAWRLDGVKD